MNIIMVSFTRRGYGILKRLNDGFTSLGHKVNGFAKSDYLEPNDGICPLEEPLGEWTGHHFHKGTGLIFIGAVGIAVRAIAPFIECKDRDPAVTVVDEMGQFAISLLSGHLGGANDLTRMTAELLGAVPVITTATDLNHQFAVDLFAKENKLEICDLHRAKKISAAVLEEKEIGLFSNFPVEGEIPEKLTINREQQQNIYITVHGLPEAGEDSLRLVPKAIIMGIGCRKNTSKEHIQRAVEYALEKQGIDRRAVDAVASIDLKQSEPGLLDFVKTWNIRFVTFSAEELQQVTGDFAESEFVRQVTGVSNVCERAALCACRKSGGHLILPKTVIDGVTVAMALRDTVLYF
ncbi:MAG: cobalt-precorrin 5A hydrolase [Clostridium sp.]